MRRQLWWLLSAAALSLVALAVGLVVAGSPRLGLLSVALLPVAAGWAIVHGQHTAAYSALSWLSRSESRTADLPGEVARATAEALLAPGATLWMGTSESLHAIGVWPPASDGMRSTDLATLLDSSVSQSRALSRVGEVTGALTVDRSRTDRLSRAGGAALR